MWDLNSIADRAASGLVWDRFGGIGVGLGSSSRMFEDFYGVELTLRW